MPSFFVEHISGNRRETTSGDNVYEQLATRRLAERQAQTEARREVSDILAHNTMRLISFR